MSEDYNIETDKDQFYIRGTRRKVQWIEDGFTQRRAVFKIHSFWFIQDFLTGETTRRRFLGGRLDEL